MAALHAYNIARVNYIKKTWINHHPDKKFDLAKPFKDINLLDVGCGGGLLAESLTRLGGNVLGLDASDKAIAIAKKHASFDPHLEGKLNYVNDTSENLVTTKKEAYDIVTSSEVIEHVENPQSFVQNLADLAKRDGLVFVSTINRTLASYMLVILGAEYVTRMVPIGTHSWDKFVTPAELQGWTESAGLKVVNVQGFYYNPLNNTMNPTSDTSTNYFMACQKI